MSISSATPRHEANLGSFPGGPPVSADAGACTVRIESGGPWTGALLKDGDRWLTVHSRRDPVREAALQLQHTDLSRAPVLFVVGLGLGYTLDALEQQDWRGRVIAFEPEPAMAQACLARRDWQAWLTAGRLTVLVGPSYEGFETIVPSIEPQSDDPAIVTHPVIARARPEEAARARDMVVRGWAGARANQAARRANAGRYLVNTLRNLPRVAASGDVAALAGCAQGTPAILVAAGPSLDRNLAEIRAYRDRAVVIAVDTAARPLLAAGIIPEFVVAVDPTEVNGRHVADLSLTAETWLVAEASLDPAGLAAFAGDVFFGKVSRHHPWPWLESHGIACGALRAWGSVLTTACDLAIQLGCDPIVFTGADLAFSRGRPYARGTTFEEDWRRQEGWGDRIEDLWASAVSAWRPVEETGVDGHPVRTAPHLVAFRDWLEVEANRQRNRRFINATGGGILVGSSIAQIALADALAMAPRLSPEIVATIRVAHRPQPDAGRRLADAVQALASHGFDAMASPFAEWIAFAARDDIATDIQQALGIVPATRRAKGAAASVPGVLPPPAPERRSSPPAPDPLEAAAVHAGMSLEQCDAALAPKDRQALAALVRTRSPQVIVDAGSACGVAGAVALAAAPGGARLYRPLRASDGKDIVAAAGLADRLAGEALDAPPADVVLLPLSGSQASSLDAAGRALDALTPSGVLVLIDECGRAAAARLHRTAYRLLESRPHAWMIDQRFVDHASRLVFLFADGDARRPDPAQADAPKWTPQHRAVARRIAPLVWSALRPLSVRDIGCGAGYWLEALHELGAQSGDGVTPAAGRDAAATVAGWITPVSFERLEVPATRRDVCLCLDVAHRLPVHLHDRLIAACAASADVVVFSSPPPGLATGTPAERPIAYWSARFFDHGYLLEDTLRPAGEEAWGFPAHAIDGLMIFRKRLSAGGLPESDRAGLRESVVEDARRLDDLYMQGIWWQVALMRRPAGDRPPGSRAPAPTAVRLRIPPHRLAAGNAGMRVFRFRTEAARWLVTHPDAALAVEEDGVALPRRATDVEARSSGGWVLWRDEIAIVAPDLSDPRTNGRSYEIIVPPHVAWAEQQPLADVLGLGL